MKIKSIVLSILFFLLSCSILSAQTKTPVSNDSIKFKFDQKFISVSPLISPRICFGLISTHKLNNQHFYEATVYIHACDDFSDYKVYGIAARRNQFFARNKKSGVFWSLNAGFDFVQMESLIFNPGGPNSDDDDIITNFGVPNFTIGLGYSFKLKNDSTIRLDWDIGFKWFLSNIYISYVW